MDGMDLSTYDEIDQGMFDAPPSDSDEDEALPIPDFIGIDSALEDDEKSRLEELNKRQTRNKSKEERELELQLLKPNSLRREILERSIRTGGQDTPGPAASTSKEPSEDNRSHVMNIVEKAGMTGIDKERINQIIHDASRGSLFYKKQAKRQAELHRDIENLLNKVKNATPEQMDKARSACDKMIEDIQKNREFNKIIVHFDLDMFFAAVEIRDNPTLEDKPVAVGGNSMLSTSNYVARRFGVRAAMPGFIARKLCPNLIIIRPNGSKYRQASSEVFAILEQYDPELNSMSLDEAYLDLTEYVKNRLEQDGENCLESYDRTLPQSWWSCADKVVGEIRAAIFAKTRLTCSAGISCNSLLAKVSTDIKKPNGQFMVRGYPKDIADFIVETKVERISGIGKVTAQLLNALDIRTCGDILTKRHLLPLVFHDINTRFYLRVGAGDGATSLKSDDQRKSKSVERTFTATRDMLLLLDKLDSICDELCFKYLKPYRIQGRTVTLKLKRNTFTVTTKSLSLLGVSNDKMVIYHAAKQLLKVEMDNDPPEISYRLIGVKLSNLADDNISSNQITIDAMLRNQALTSEAQSSPTLQQLAAESNQEENSNQAATSKQRPQPAAQEDSRSSTSRSETPRPSSASSKQPVSSAKGSRKRTSPPDGPSIESFFRKIPKTSTSVAEPEPTISHNQDQNREPVSVFAYDEPPTPLDDVYQCPYCTRPSVDFAALETHVAKCSFKISMDVNRSFFSQVSQAVPSPSAGPSKSQIPRPKNPFKRTTASSRASASHATAKPSTSKSATSDHQGPKQSFYDKFLESNSQCFERAKKTEPMRCPHCAHGFLSFDLLESHVKTCIRRQLK